MKFRDNGPVGALLDVYEEQIDELKTMLQNNFTTITPSSDPKAWTVHRVMNHVLYTGLLIPREICKKWGGSIGNSVDSISITTIQESLNLLDQMFSAMENALSDKVEFKPVYFKESVESPWGEFYDLAQYVEYAIVHVMRHHRQIRKDFL